MEHLSGSDAHSHSGVTATDRCADTGTSAACDPTALIDSDADTNRAHTGADTHIYSATADTDA